MYSVSAKVIVVVIVVTDFIRAILDPKEREPLYEGLDSCSLLSLYRYLLPNALRKLVSSRASNRSSSTLVKGIACCSNSFLYSSVIKLAISRYIVAFLLRVLFKLLV